MSAGVFEALVRQLRYATGLDQQQAASLLGVAIDAYNIFLQIQMHATDIPSGPRPHEGLIAYVSRTADVDRYLATVATRVVVKAVERFNAETFAFS